MKKRITFKPQKKFMKLAIEEAKKAGKKGYTPIGAVVIKENKVIGRSGQISVIEKDPTGHAEIKAIRMAAKKLKTNYLHGCVLYVTNEPCAMCSGAGIWSCISGIVYGANIKDMENFWVKKRKKDKEWIRMIYIPCEEVQKRSKPKNSFFIIKNFMRKECNKLFNLSPDMFRDKKKK